MMALVQMLAQAESEQSIQDLVFKFYWAFGEQDRKNSSRSTHVRHFII